MNRRILKIIVAVWSIFISVDEVVAFATSGTFSFQTFPYVAVLLLAVGVLIFIPGFDKFDRFLVLIAVIFFGYFTIMGVIDFVRFIPQTTLENLFPYISSALKGIVFYLIPATLGVMYLTYKKR